MIEVIKGGLYTTVQDYPGRVGYWSIGIPPSGPMDNFAFRVANALVGNRPGEAGLEITAIGPKLRFGRDAVVALTGAMLSATLDGAEVPWWESFRVPAGSVLSLGGVKGWGNRAFLAIRGGIDVPLYLGSRSTFPFGQFGGIEGRPIKAGDLLSVQERPTRRRSPGVKRLHPELVPSYSAQWDVSVLPGPHEAPDFFTPADVDLFYETAWQVHHNSNRLGYRLVGPSPQFARADGGEGGRHPSNIHDCAYAIGTINFTGNAPVILMVDGPSLGGFVSIATIIAAEIWKVGQARAGDTIRFRRVTMAQALQLRRHQERLLRGLARQADAKKEFA